MTIDFDWSSAQSVLQDFGGKKETFYVPKTGLPFFDALRLYGAIDLYIGLREDVMIKDNGNEWEVVGSVRQHHVLKKDEDTFKLTGKKRPAPAAYCQALREHLYERNPIANKDYVKTKGAFSKFDPILQAGIRGISAYTYETLQTGETSTPVCIATIPLYHGLLAFAGKKRTATIGNIVFLPVFEGRVDFSKVISPLRVWLNLPNVICSQALAILALKTSLHSEGYQKQLSAVVFKTNLGSQRSDNYSGMISIKSTAIAKLESSNVVSRLYSILKSLVIMGWKRVGREFKSTEFSSDALAMAYWLVQPFGKHLASMITSQEKLKASGYQHIFIEKEYVKEVFNMSYGDWNGDFEAVHKLAKAVASAIYFARQSKANEGEKGKAWYDEVVMLRSAPTPKAFFERILILLEQGHREHGQVGTIHRDEIFDPSDLFKSIGKDRSDFETFRDLFRMYLVQESTYKAKYTETAISDTEIENLNNLEKEE
jgi:hypothetical protein